MNKGERQGCRGTVSGKIRLGCEFNRLTAVIISYDGELSAYRLCGASTSIITHDEPVCNRFSYFL